METKTKDNGQAKVASTVQADKSPKFVAGNPVNKISEKEEAKPVQDPKAGESGFVNVNKLEEQKGDATAKPEAKAQAAEHKPALNLEQTLKLVAELAKKTALRDKYSGYIDDLSAFVIAQNDEDDMAKDAANFKSCELVIRDGQGHDFRTTSAMVIAGTVSFMSGRFTERLAEVESEIVLPA
jgi:hypothetical protein